MENYTIRNQFRGSFVSHDFYFKGLFPNKHRLQKFPDEFRISRPLELTIVGKKRIKSKKITIIILSTLIFNFTTDGPKAHRRLAKLQQAFTSGASGSEISPNFLQRNQFAIVLCYNP